MGVYIKGMEMPTSPVLFCIHPDGNVFADLEGNWREYKAIHVPPHGNLKDADELFKEMERKGWYNNADRDMAEDLVYYAPTIIQAEEGE